MKKQAILLLSALNMCSAESFETYQQNISDEYTTYYQKELKAFDGFIQTSDGIPNKINPYQQVTILPPPPLSVVKPVKPLPSTAIEKPIAPEPKILEKPKNTLPEGTPSGSQIKSVKLQEIDISKLIPLEPTLISKIPSTVSPQTIQLSFFGASIPIDQSVVAFIKKLSVGSDISKLAQDIHESDTALTNNLRSISTTYDLNDWDKVLLVQTLMNTLYSVDQHKLKTVHAVDLLRGLGYKTLLGEGGDKNLYFLLSAIQQIYAKSFYERDGGRFYLFSIDAHPRADFKTPITFYHSPDDTQGSALDMTMYKDPKLGMDQKPVMLHWDFEKKNYSMSVNANKNLAALMDMYPQVDYEMYMRSRSGANLIHALSLNLKQEITNNHFTKEQSVAFILRFAQQAFSYKTDFDAYGFERPMFVEQTILLPYSDCEDRAILLSQLYRETLGIDSIGLQYPGHISLGVSYEGKGDYYTLSQEKFYVTDGTYFYANPGMSQPSFKNAAAKFLRTK